MSPFYFGLPSLRQSSLVVCDLTPAFVMDSNAFAFSSHTHCEAMCANLLSFCPLLVSCLCPLPLSPLGGDERNRTADPLLARQVLSQLSYTPILKRILLRRLDSPSERLLLCVLSTLRRLRPRLFQPASKLCVLNARRSVVLAFAFEYFSKGFMQFAVLFPLQIIQYRKENALLTSPKSSLFYTLERR